jgi:RNA polymerase sigma-70 factor (ECF subfamily)
MSAPEVDESEVRDLLQHVRSGDRAALDRLLAAHRNYLLSIVQLRMDHQMRARVDPSDVVQEAQIQAARRIEDYLGHEPMPFHLWLRRAAYDNLLRLRRQHVVADCRSVANEIPLPDSSSALVAQRILSSEPNPGQVALEQELTRRLQQSIAELPAMDAEILLMRTLEGLSNQDAAQVLDIDQNTASKRYGRAILKLRQILLESGLSDSKL